MQKITPFIWFNGNAEEAMNFYTSIFENSVIVEIHRYPKGVKEGPLKGFDGKVMTGIFELEGQRFMAIDGAPIFKSSGTISFYVECETQEEVDHYWSNLSAVKEAEQCGWLKDKYGLSWQIIPKALGELLSNPDKVKAGKVMQAMLKMKKIDIQGLKDAAEQK